MAAKSVSKPKQVESAAPQNPLIGTSGIDTIDSVMEVVKFMWHVTEVSDLSNCDRDATAGVALIMCMTHDALTHARAQFRSEAEVAHG